MAADSVCAGAVRARRNTSADAHTPLVILLGTAGGTGIALRTDILSGTVLTIPVFGPLAAKFGTALLARLLFGIVVARYVVELVGVFLKGRKT